MFCLGPSAALQSRWIRNAAKVATVTVFGSMPAALAKCMNRDRRVFCNRVGRRYHSVCHDADRGVRWRPGLISRACDIAARSSDLTFAQRPGDSPMATSATSERRLARRRGSAGSSSTRRPSALATVRTAEVSSCRRRSGKSALANRYDDVGKRRAPRDVGS